MPRRVLITGIAGFVGTNLCSYLLSEGYEIVGIDIGDRHKRLLRSTLSSHPKLTVQWLDLAKGEVTSTKGVAAIFHLAALPHVDYSRFHPHQVITNNIETTVTAIELALKLKAPLIFSSSVEVYGGRADRIYGEDDILDPLCPYAASKVACEALIKSYIETHGLRATILRLTNLYGPWQAPDRLLPRVISQTLLGEKSEIERGTNRDFVYIQDACNVLGQSIDFPHDGDIFNLCAGRRVDNTEAIDSIMDILPNPNITIVPRKNRDGRGRYLVARPEKLQKQSGWHASTRLADGIAATVTWYTANREWLTHFESNIRADRSSDAFLTDTTDWR